MNPFKEGDRIRCIKKISAEHKYGQITVGKEYVVRAVYANRVYILNDKEEEFSYVPDVFELVDDVMCKCESCAGRSL